jgi:hypothetical protein
MPPMHHGWCTQAWIYDPAFVMAQGGVANAEAGLIGGIEGGLTYFNIHTAVRSEPN